MKKIIFAMALAGLAQWAKAQANVPAEVLKNFPRVVQFTQMSVQVVKVKTYATLGSAKDSFHTISDEKGEPFSFTTSAEVVNYMERQGFQFLAFVPENKAGAPALVAYLPSMLFERKP